MGAVETGRGVRAWSGCSPASPTASDFTPALVYVGEGGLYLETLLDSSRLISEYSVQPVLRTLGRGRDTKRKTGWKEA